MYGIIHDSIFKSSVRDSWQALVTFMALITLADEDDNVDMTLSALSGHTGIPLEVITEGIRVLEEPDPQSRSLKEDGRRITRLDEHRTWGWHIVNRDHYKRMRDLEMRKSYMRQHMRKRRGSKMLHGVSSVLANVSLEQESRREGEKKEKTLAQTDVRASLKLISFEDTFWPAYPRKVGKAAASKAWKKLTQSELDAVMEGLRRYKATEWQGREIQFIPHASSWLNGRRWDDDLSPAHIPSTPRLEEGPRRQRAEDREKSSKWRQEYEKDLDPDGYWRKPEEADA